MAKAAQLGLGSYRLSTVRTFLLAGSCTLDASSYVLAEVICCFVRPHLAIASFELKERILENVLLVLPVDQNAPFFVLGLLL